MGGEGEGQTRTLLHLGLLPPPNSHHGILSLHTLVHICISVYPYLYHILVPLPIFLRSSETSCMILSQPLFQSSPECKLSLSLSLSLSLPPSLDLSPPLIVSSLSVFNALRLFPLSPCLPLSPCNFQHPLPRCGPRSPSVIFVGSRASWFREMEPEAPNLAAPQPADHSQPPP